MADFPPSTATTLQKVIASYLYLQYNDDEALIAFVNAFNQYAQAYVDAINGLNLPVYTGLSGDLLDWVGQGLYGVPRPTLPLIPYQKVGPIDTWALNTIPLNTWANAPPRFDFVPGDPIGTFAIGISEVGGHYVPIPNVYVTNDDSYKRILTWLLYKGDGRLFNIRWLKRRIQRFLDGVNGTDPGVSTTYSISVTFGTGSQVNIRIAPIVRSILDGAILNTFALNTQPLNNLQTHAQSQAPNPEAPILQSAIESGAATLPFQFSWVVTTT